MSFLKKSFADSSYKYFLYFEISIDLRKVPKKILEQFKKYWLILIFKSLKIEWIISATVKIDYENQIYLFNSF